MIRKCYIYHCDVCGKETMVSANPPEEAKAGWSYFTLDTAEMYYAKLQEPTLICPDCTKRIKVCIDYIRKDKVKGDPLCTSE